jgi:hypothetical protein
LIYYSHEDDSIGIWPLIVVEGMGCGWTISSKIKGRYNIITHFRYNIISVIFQTYIGLLQFWAAKSLVTYNSLTTSKDVKEEERLNPIRLFIKCPRQG